MLPPNCSCSTSAPISGQSARCVCLTNRSRISSGHLGHGEHQDSGRCPSATSSRTLAVECHSWGTWSDRKAGSNEGVQPIHDRIVGRLRQRGYPVKWSVYGDGPMRPSMEERIRALGLGNSITVLGSVKHSEFARVLRTAYAFVGMGTALIEAALCGVPGIVALAYDTTGVSYGLLYNLPFGNVGELSDQAPASSVEEQIESILQCSEADYASVVTRSIAYAKQYDLNRSMNLS